MLIFFDQLVANVVSLLSVEQVDALTLFDENVCLKQPKLML